MTDLLQRQAMRNADSMEVFADGKPTFVWGEWQAWRKACQESGAQIPPAEFKAKFRAAALPDHPTVTTDDGRGGGI